MNLIFFSHPQFLGSQSMPRYTAMLAEGMKERGHRVEVWLPEAKMINLLRVKKFRKWLGYVDQFYVFPNYVRKRLKTQSADTLFVFTDHALGPWVPLVSSRPHVIHCHDFLAQRSAKNEINENPTKWTGRQYQAYIRRGYSKGKNFVSVSENTRADLHRFLPARPYKSELAYNGLNAVYQPFDKDAARAVLTAHTGLDLSGGYFLHVGGNQWYKNRVGVVKLYDAWRSKYRQSIPLLLLGEEPNAGLLKAHHQSPYKGCIHFVPGLSDNNVHMAYAGASALLFPSLAEGFGWPIAEAMASGCPVITTAEAPMTEVAGGAALLIPSLRSNNLSIEEWTKKGADVMNDLISKTGEEREKIVNAGLESANRFRLDLVLDQMEGIYKNILQTFPNHERSAHHW